MTIKLLHNRDCHIWQTAAVELEAALTEAGLSIQYQVVRIETEDQSRAERFSGSPTITIDGVDIDPMAKNLTRFGVAGCRPYFFQNKTFEFPPKTMILQALKRHG